MKKGIKENVSTIGDIWAEFENIPSVEEIVKNSTPLDLDADPEFVAAYLKAQFIEDIYKTMASQGLNKNKLADKMGKSPQYVGKILNEHTNFTLETLAEIACTLDMRVAARMYTKDERMVILPVLNKKPELLTFSSMDAYVNVEKVPEILISNTELKLAS